jgi:hypothetical protein
MKIVLDIETVQPSREEWARLTGKPSSTDLLSNEECMDLFSASAADEAGFIHHAQRAQFRPAVYPETVDHPSDQAEHGD